MTQIVKIMFSATNILLPKSNISPTLAQYCQAQFQFSASQVELRLAILSLSVHPPTHQPTHQGKYI